MSKDTSIRHESELVHEFQQLLAADKELPWRPDPQASRTRRISHLELELDGRHFAFEPYYSVSPSLTELAALQPEHNGAAAKLLVTPRLTPRVLDFCRAQRLSAIDLNGRAYLRADGLLVDRCELPDRDFRFVLEPRNVFVGKSVRIVRALLADRDREWTQSDLVPRTRATSGLVSRIVNHLIRLGLLEKLDYRRFRLREPLALLDEWARADDFARRTLTARYTALGSAQELADKLQTLLRGQHLDFAFTQWFAGWTRHPYTEPLVVSAYVATLPSDAAFAEIGLRPAPDAGNIWLLQPADEGVLFETQTVAGRPLVTDAQIYLDLLKTGLRGPDQATALREWSGFLRP